MQSLRITSNLEVIVSNNNKKKKAYSEIRREQN